jgi:HD-GYP domain-containing protein (c-di-GMP phosphodiesterase class II)
MAPSLALEQLVRGRGEQFDPDVVDAMIDVVTNRA